MSLNAYCIVLLEKPRDATQVCTTNVPGKSEFLVESFRDATEEPFGYSLPDLKPDIVEVLRVRTCIFPHERQFVYLPK